MAVLRTLGRGRSYLALGTPRLQPVCVSRGGREGGQGTCTPRPWPFCARRGGGEATWHWDAPAVVGLRDPGWVGGVGGDMHAPAVVALL